MSVEPTRRALAACAAAALVATVVAANVLTSRYGLVWAGPGLTAAAGTYCAGLALGLRDAVHDTGGWRWAIVSIAAGIVVSAAMGDGRIALASAVAFGVAELADQAVYAPLRRRAWRTAVVASGAVGAVLDTLLFLSIAGFDLTAAIVAGQLVVKAAMTVGYLAAAEGVSRAVPRERVQPVGA